MDVLRRLCQPAQRKNCHLGFFFCRAILLADPDIFPKRAAARVHRVRFFQVREMESDYEIEWRDEVRQEDKEIIRRLCASSGFFSAEEVNLAVSLLQERLEKGPASGYIFLFAQYGDEVLGFACYGPIAGTEASWDLYWMAVEEKYRGHGWGEQLHAEVEKRVLRSGGRRLYIWTSSRDQYVPTRRFYERLDYVKEATLRNYYRPGEHLVIYAKSLS